MIMFKRHIALIIALILAVAGVLGIILISANTLDPIDKTELTLNKSYGDPSFAEGLNVSSRMVSASGASVIRWDTDMLFNGSGMEHTAVHDYNASGQIDSYFPRTSYSTIRLTADLMRIPGLYYHLMKELEDADIGEVRVVDVNISDFTDQYPLAFVINGDYTYFSSENMQADDIRRDYYRELNDKFNSLVKLSPGPHDIMQITCAKTVAQNGRNVEILAYDFHGDGSGLNNTGFYMSRISGFYRDGAYYLVAPAINDPHVVYPNGPGLYTVPEVQVVLQGDDYKLEFDSIDMDRLTKLMDFDEGYEQCSVAYSVQSGLIAILAENSSGYKEYIYPIDGSSKGQSFELERAVTSDYTSAWLGIKNGIVILETEEAYDLAVPGADGIYSMHSFPRDSSFETEENIAEIHFYDYEKTFDYDGTRLAVAGYYRLPLSEVKNQARVYEGIYTAVYQEDGLKYYSAYTDSLKDVPFLSIWWLSGSWAGEGTGYISASWK